MRHLKMIWARISSHQLFRIARFSRPVVSLLRFFRKRERLSFASSVEFYSKLSQHRMRLVFDIGANRGDKTEVFREVSAKVVAVDPDPANYQVLRVRFPWSQSVVIKCLGLGPSAGYEKFFMTRSGSAINTFSDKWRKTLSETEVFSGLGKFEFGQSRQVELTTLDLLIAEFGIPDYIKIDVEGFEVQVLRGLSMPVGVVSFECNLPIFLSETVECIRHLVSLDRRYVFNAYDDHVWAFSAPVTSELMCNWIEADCPAFSIEIYAFVAMDGS